MLSLDELTSPVSRDEAEEKLYDVLDSVGTNTSSWKPGSWRRGTITGFAILYSAFTQLSSNLAKMGFLELTEGVWLTLKARYDYKVEREEATFASGELTLTNTGGGLFELEAEDLVVLNPTTKKSYRNTGDFTLEPLGEVTIPIVALEAGSASTSTPDTITEFVTSLDGVTCTNELSVVGTDEEEDPTVKTKCSEKLGSLSPMGPWDAYAYAARTAVRTDGTTVGVTRVRTTKDGFGNVYCYVATATGEVTGDADDAETDLGAVNEAVQRYAAALGDTAWVLSATAVPIAVTYALWIYRTTGLTDVQISDAAALSITAFLSAQPIGGDVIDPDTGKVFKSGIEGAISSTRQPANATTKLPIFRVVVSTPASDTDLALSEVAVPGTITPTITQVTPPEGGF